MKKIVVTGGGGFIGSNLTKKLLKDPENHVIVFDNINQSESLNLREFFANPNFEFIKGDVTNPSTLDNILAPDIDYVYHLAAVVGIKHYIGDPLRLINVNVLGTKNVLENALKNNIKVLFTSTSEIYGKNPNTPWKEDDDRVLGSTKIDRWNYSTSKAICEHMVNSMHRVKGLNATIVRYFNAFGPKQQPYFVASQTLHRIMNDERPLMYDGGNQTRCFTFIEDAIDGTIMAATDPRGNGETFNIGNNKETSIKDLIETVINVCGKKGGIVPEDLDTSVYYGKTYEDITRRVPDVSKAKEILGWEATTNLREGLEKTVSWINQNKWWLDLKR